MNELAAVLICLFGGLTGGLVGVGGGVLFVPALTIFIGLTQVEAESTSLLMIVIVAIVGSYRQYGYGNVRLREALIVGALSPLRSEEHTSELQSRRDLVCRLLLEKKKK